MQLMWVQQAFAATELKSRLNTPAHTYKNVSTSMFVGIQKVGSRVIAVGEGGLIAYSDDAGKEWTQAEVPVSNTLTSLYFTDKNQGWVVGHGGVILHTKNAGITWEKQFDGNQANKLILMQINQQLNSLKQAYEAADELEQEDLLFEIENAEYALSDAEFDTEMGAANPLLDVWFENENKGYVVGAYGFFFATNNGGKSWQFIAGRMDNIDRYHLNAIQKIKGGAILIAGEAGILFTSNDRGETWETLYGPYQGSYFGIQNTKNKNEVLVYGLRGNVYKSNDNGQSWEKIETPVSTSLAGSTLSDDGTITLVGFSGTVLESSDDGQSFKLNERVSLDAYTAVESLNGNQLIVASEKGITLQ
ncbi:MAG: photosystem II stability/assembly factor-like uncharacterized protein [Oleiphilaceae bacterium]|jgi:photosystem II stability/assembly factor-like uncharacterized protein